MSEQLMTTLKVTPGSIIVNSAYIHKAAGGIACIYVDLHSKYAEVGCVGGGGEEPPLISLGRGKRTRFYSRRKSDTIVEFVDFKGWKVFACEMGRYTLAVCLVTEVRR